MRTLQIEGIATISENGFSFNSGLPENETVFDNDKKMRGVMKISQNACADFISKPTVRLAPELNAISHGDGYRIKRSSRNYIIQIKVPVVEKRVESEDRLMGIMPQVLGDITLDRRELLGE